MLLPHLDCGNKFLVSIAIKIADRMLMFWHNQVGVMLKLPTSLLRRLAYLILSELFNLPLPLCTFHGTFFRRVVNKYFICYRRILIRVLVVGCFCFRFVNCFVGHKKTKFSIAELADSIGIPRVLVDIRHGKKKEFFFEIGHTNSIFHLLSHVIESSHRDLPSLQRVRHASVKVYHVLMLPYRIIIITVCIF